MRASVWLLACFAPLVAGAAEPAPSATEPVLVVLRTHYAAQELDAGLIGMLATRSVNKTSARKVEKFTATLASSDFPQKLRAAFACFAHTDACAGSETFTEREPFEAALRASASRQGYVVEVVPELVPDQILIRASAYRMTPANDVSQSAIRVGAGYHALFTWRAPADVAALRKSNPRALEAYWSEGEPRRIVSVTQRGLAEINALFELLIHKSKGGFWADGQPVVTAWDFPDKQRLACRGKALCGMTYVLKDNGDSFVLVHAGTFAGWFDSSAAAHESCLPALATFGVP